MPIVKTTNTRITVTYAVGDPKGDSWDNFWTLDDVVDADVGVTKSGNVYAFHNLQLRIDGSSCYMKILNSVMVFTGDQVPVSTAASFLVENYNGGNLQFGNKYISGKCNEGSTVIVNTDPVGGVHRIRLGYFYASSLLCKKKSDTSGVGIYATLVENSFISGGGTETFYKTSAQLKNSLICNCYYGTRSPNIASSWENTVINGAAIGIWIYDGRTGLTLRNVITEACTTGLRQNTYANQSIENTVIGCVFNNYVNTMSGTTTQYSYSILHIGEEFSVTVSDADGNKLDEANVKLYDKDNVLIFDQNTDAEGYYGQDVIKIDDICERKEPDFTTQRTIINYNPFTIIISYAGKPSYEAKIEITKKTDLQIELIPPIYYNQSLKGKIEQLTVTGLLKQQRLKGVISQQKITGKISQDTLIGKIKNN